MGIFNFEVPSGFGDFLYRVDYQSIIAFFEI